ncbi:MAG: hypothetical protein R2735_16065 [Microthrixaceae bacterium]
MRRIGAAKRNMILGIVTVATLLLGTSVASAGSYWNGTKTTVSGTTWQGWVWGGIQNPVAGYNMYLRIDNGDTPAMYVRWRNCAGTSSGSLFLSNATPFQGTLGTSFIYHACTMPESRFVNTSASGTNVAMFETYFDNHYRW